MQPLVRPFEPEDCRRCAQILTEAGRQAFFWTNWPDFDQERFSQATAEEMLLVAEASGVVIGFVAVHVPSSFVHHLYIDPQTYRRGVGGLLLDAALDRHGPASTLKCQVRNEAARAFYRQAGWVEDAAIGGIDELGDWLWIRSSAVTPAAAPAVPPDPARIARRRGRSGRRA